MRIITFSLLDGLGLVDVACQSKDYDRIQLYIKQAHALFEADEFREKEARKIDQQQSLI